MDGKKKGIIALCVGFLIALALLLAGSALYPKYKWIPMLLLLFYCLIPIPLVVCAAFQKGDQYSDEPGQYGNFGLFLAAFLVTSTFALPFVLLRVGSMASAQVGYSVAANVVLLLAGLYAAYQIADDDDGGYFLT